jgi:peptide/nickel transport system permease protein
LLPFIIKRCLIYIPMLFLFSIVAFAIIQAPPGDYLTDYVAAMQAAGEHINQSEVDSLRERYGLGEPIYVQYWKWFSGILTWDLGESLEWQQPVTELVNSRLAMTVTLALFTILFVWTMAIPIGIISAVKQYSWIDNIFTTLSYIGVGTPNFVLALVIMWTTFYYFDLSVTGLFSNDMVDAPWSFAKVKDLLAHIWVPMLILGTDGTARITRIMRANLLDELNKPYVETARAKGLSEVKLLMKYPVRLAVNPLVSTVGWSLPQLFSGSLIVATVMSLNTIGPLLLRALQSQDFYMAGSILFILTTLTLIGTLISDILLGVIDPRIRLEG